MPSAPLLDFETLDLTRTVATQAEILSKIKQRGRFALLDGVLHFGLEKPLIVGFKDIRGDDWWAADHIPGRPIFPGALMIEAAAQLASYDFMCRTKAAPETADLHLRHAGLRRTRAGVRGRSDRTDPLRESVSRSPAHGAKIACSPFESALPAVCVGSSSTACT